MRYVDVGGEFRPEVSALERDKRPLVAHGVTIIGCRENCDAFAVVHELIAVLFDLVTAHYVVETVVLEESLSHVWTKLAAHAPFGGGPTSHALRIRPKELAHNTLIRRLAIPLSFADVIKRYTILHWGGNDR